MKQIIPGLGMAFPEKDKGVEVDTSALSAAGIAHYEHSGTQEWIERDHFEGREEVPDSLRPAITAILEAAEAAMNQPPEDDTNAVPQSVTARQGLQQLIVEGLDEAAAQAIGSIPDEVERKLARAWFDRASTWERDNPQLNQIGDALGLSEAQKDDLFRQAAQR